MANLKEIRGRIDSVTSTQQITSAMKMVSVSKLRRTQKVASGLRPYLIKLTEIIGNLWNSGVSVDDVWFKEKEVPKNVLLLAIASNRGMCGAFNMNVAKKVETMLKTEYKELHEKGLVKIITAGKSLANPFKYKKIPIVESWDELSDNHSFENFVKASNQLMNDFKSGKYDKVIIIYNQFINALKQTVLEEQFLPIVKSETKDSNKLKNSHHFSVKYIYEPSKEVIFKEVVPKMLRIQLYKAFLDSSAAEHGARMTAMHQSSDNAAKLLKELKTSYNKARQMSITNELLEIVSGAF